MKSPMATHDALGPMIFGSCFVSLKVRVFVLKMTRRNISECLVLILFDPIITIESSLYLQHDIDHTFLNSDGQAIIFPTESVSGWYSSKVFFIADVNQIDVPICIGGALILVLISVFAWCRDFERVHFPGWFISPM